MFGGGAAAFGLLAVATGRGYGPLVARIDTDRAVAASDRLSLLDRLLVRI